MAKIRTLWFLCVFLSINAQEVTLVEGDRYVMRSENYGTFQWYKDGLLIPGATESTFVIYYMLEGDAGEYSVKWEYKAQKYTKSVIKLSYKPLLNLKGLT